MEDTDELRWALKVVIKRQMRDLLQQLHDVGEEMAILSVNVSEGTASHFGTSQGEWFLSEQKNIKGSFLKYCQSMSKKSAGKPNLQPWLEDINATLESSITTNEEHISPEPSGSSKKSQADQRMLAAKGKKPQPVYLSGKKSSKEPGKAVIKIKVPKGMITSGTSDKDLSGLVGRLLDQELKAQKSKTAASDTDTQNKFSSLLEAANIAKEQVKKTLGKRASSDDAQSVSKRTRRSGPASGESPEKGGGDTTRSLRSGRAVSSRFLEGIASLKPKTLGKDKKDESDAEEHSDMDHSESMNLEGAELETVSAQLSKELEQMTLPVLERLETATSEGEVFDDREIKGVVGQRKDQRATIFVVRCPQGDPEDGEVEIAVELPSESDEKSNSLSKADIENIAEDIVNKVKNSQTQTPIADHDYNVDNNSDWDSDISDYNIENTSENADLVEPDSAPTNAAKKTFKCRQRKTSQKPFFACKYCDKLFGRKSDCIRHEKRSAMTKSCVKADDNQTEGAASSADSQNKLDLTHKGSDEYRREVPQSSTTPSVDGLYHCPKCPKKLKGSSNFFCHLRVVHENYRPHNCEVCGKTFGTKSNYANHQIAVHTRKCDSCGSYVAETEPWAKGVTKHTERNILCGNCNKIVLFYSGTKLPVTAGTTVKRVKRERSDKDKDRQTYACEVCDKLFHKLYECKRHQQKHTDEKYNMCDVCGRQFKHLTSLQQHQKIHEDSYVPYSCWICDTKFELKHSFVQHIHKVHGLDFKSAEEGTEATVQIVVDETTIEELSNNILQLP